MRSVLGLQREDSRPDTGPPDYNWNDWWHYAQGLIAFQNEIVKYVYYRFRY